MEDPGSAWLRKVMSQEGHDLDSMPISCAAKELPHSSILPLTYELIHSVSINWAPSIQPSSVQSSGIAMMLKKKSHVPVFIV